jgi:hypothetical protein
VERAVASLAPAQVQVVFTARDLARQLPSDWQEHLKHQHRVPFARFVADLIELGPAAPPPYGEMFWHLHDPADVLERWASVVPAERIHVVTVPQPGAPPQSLWQRFASVLGVDAAVYTTEVARMNSSLGLVECELLRRVNERLNGRLSHRHYDVLVRLRLTAILTSAEKDAARPVLPPQWHPWAVERSKKMVDAIRTAGYDVVGDLDELVPRAPDADHPATQPEDVGSDELLAPALTAISGLLAELARSRDRLAEREAALALWRERPVRQWLIDRSVRHSSLMTLRRAYWRVANEVRDRRGPG